MLLALIVTLGEGPCDLDELTDGDAEEPRVIERISFELPPELPRPLPPDEDFDFDEPPPPPPLPPLPPEGLCWAAAAAAVMAISSLCSVAWLYRDCL